MPAWLLVSGSKIVTEALLRLLALRWSKWGPDFEGQEGRCGPLYTFEGLLLGMSLVAVAALAGCESGALHESIVVGLYL